MARFSSQIFDNALDISGESAGHLSYCVARLWASLARLHAASGTALDNGGRRRQPQVGDNAITLAESV
jgi:hypothetical protein